MPSAANLFELSALGKLPVASENNMKKATRKRKPASALRQEYDLSSLKGGVRGKYFERYQSGTNLVLLSPDVARHFPNEQSVNSALRELIRAGKRPLRRARWPRSSLNPRLTGLSPTKMATPPASIPTCRRSDSSARN